MNEGQKEGRTEGRKHGRKEGRHERMNEGRKDGSKWTSPVPQRRNEYTSKAAVGKSEHQPRSPVSYQSSFLQQSAKLTQDQRKEGRTE